MNPSPMPLDHATADSLTLETVSQIKRIDCAMYNGCLDQAIAGNWPGFGCHNCKAYKAIEIDQRRLDVQGLLVVLRASENVENSTRQETRMGENGLEKFEVLGSANRKRGVKPGADAKVSARRRLPVLMERNEVKASMFPLGLAIIG